MKEYQIALRSLRRDKERIPQRKNDLIALYEQWKNRTPLGVADLMIVTDDDDVDVNVEEEDVVIDDAVAI